MFFTYSSTAWPPLNSLHLQTSRLRGKIS